MKEFIKQKLEEGFGYGETVQLLHLEYGYTYEECVGFVAKYIDEHKK